MPGRQRIEARGNQGREGWDEFQGERILGERPGDGNSREGPTTPRPRAVGDKTPPCGGWQGVMSSGEDRFPSAQEEKRLRTWGILPTSGQNSRNPRARICGAGGVGDWVRTLRDEWLVVRKDPDNLELRLWQDWPQWSLG